MVMEDLTEEERRALRGSKFAPLPSQSTSSRSHPRLAHPGGPLKTNKAAALAKFLHRKLNQDPNALSSINPQILDLAVRNAKASVHSSGTNIRHVDTFDDPEASFDEGESMNSEPKKQKKKNKKKKNKNKKNKRQKIVEDSECGVGGKPKKKLRL
ncbi:uncharacterized protein LOC101221899 isoform X2 [Cucumis sativus]|uniref:Uncharacterized protein n=1 Tax=Cucumis sativus TaxID=3659 RepID=A0A0A0LAK0_CUCSA|nr:uncharacterized protein LOC101221899 isoform X2 [Cucumis sativus]KGN57091.1 hypothetical protein Csa_009526 [Cucumis sativus]